MLISHFSKKVSTWCRKARGGAVTAPGTFGAGAVPARVILDALGTTQPLTGM